MENKVDALDALGQNRLEQVYMNMPEIRFYFSGDREQEKDNLKAYLEEEELELQSLQRFSESDEGVYYYLLLDVSASISKAEFSDIIESLAEFSETVRPQDHIAFITFGEEVRTLFSADGEELRQGTMSERIKKLENNDQRTLLFEAIHQVSDLSKSVSFEESARRVAYVITDGADIAKGKATKEEALKALQQSGIPVYGFASAGAAGEAVNQFGAFSRATGGYLTIIEKDKASFGFEAVREGILQSYEAVFLADSNRASHKLTDAALEFISEGEKQQMQVMQDRWIKDLVQPVVKEIVSEGASQIRVVFSEAVDGIDAAENFQLKSEDLSLIPEFASGGSDGTSTVLSFSENLKNGTYELICSNITDCSMEENPLEGSAYVEIDVSEDRDFSDLWKDYGWIIVLIVLAFLLGAALIGWRRLKKRHALVTVDDKMVLSQNTQVRRHVLMEQKKLQEKKVYFHVLGQKEEIPITIRKSMIVGRSSACELIFDDPALSRQHFALELKGDGVLIQNLSQSGYTEVNGVRLDTGIYELHPGDEIHAGQLKMTVRW